MMEVALADFKRMETSASFSTGLVALAATTSTIAGKDEIIFSDRLNHASIIDACRFSRAMTVVYEHNDMGDLERKLTSTPRSSARLVVTDGVFSMEGDICNLPELRCLADRYRCQLMVDDAHATGVLGRTGRGTAEHFWMEDKIDIVSGTMSKSLGAVGGLNASRRIVTEYLRYNSQPSAFSTALPPSMVATVTAALDVPRTEPERIEQLRQNARFMHRGLADAGFALNDHGAPIIPILVGADTRAYRMAGRLEDEGILPNPVVFPAVQHGKSIIRISLMATHTTEQLGSAPETPAHRPRTGG